MKKLLLMVVLTLMISLTGCGNNETPDTPDTPEAPTAKDNYESYIAADLDSEVEVLMSVQAHQAWWQDGEVGKVTIYGQDDDGGYFAYEVKTDEATANAMTPGTLIRVKGFKSEWAGEIEIMDGTVEIIAGGFDGKVYDPVDVTDLIGTEALADKMNQKVSISGLEVVEVSKKDSEYDPDLYITAKLGDTQVDLCVENYLTDPNTEVYQTGASLQAGDVIDVECFLYWYNAPNPHITSITKK